MIHQYDIPIPELVERYKLLYSGLISDCLDRVGLYYQFMHHSIQPMSNSIVIAGPAFTVSGSGERTLDKSKRLGTKVVDDIGPYEVAVMQTNGDEQTGHWGELLSNGAIVRGATGAVVDGGIRDSAAIRKLGFPIFCKFHCPGDAYGRWNVVDIQVPISAGNVKVCPGDFIFGDSDGVVVIPKHLVVKILLASEKARDEENEIRSRILNGEKLTDLYTQYEQF